MDLVLGDAVGWASDLDPGWVEVVITDADGRTWSIVESVDRIGDPRLRPDAEYPMRTGLPCTRKGRSGSTTVDVQLAGGASTQEGMSRFRMEHANVLLTPIGSGDQIPTLGVQDGEPAFVLRHGRRRALPGLLIAALLPTASGLWVALAWHQASAADQTWAFSAFCVATLLFCLAVRTFAQLPRCAYAFTERGLHIVTAKGSSWVRWADVQKVTRVGGRGFEDAYRIEALPDAWHRTPKRRRNSGVVIVDGRSTCAETVAPLLLAWCRIPQNQRLIGTSRGLAAFCDPRTDL